MNFEILDKTGKKIECNVVGTFESNNKSFILYTDGTEVNEEKEVYASLYKLNYDNSMILLPITDDNDWDLVDKYLEEM